MTRNALLKLALSALALLCIAVLASIAPRTDASSTGDARALSPIHVPVQSAQLIQIALCLDTSGSMDGLIESAKAKLWAIVSELATAEPTPQLEVALLTYGNDGHLAENGWVQIDSPLTRDLDEISDRLFALTTNGGSEYVARVLRRTDALSWGEDPSVLRIVVVAGNEPADQDSQFVNSEVCRDLESRGILVNAIYCGPAEDEQASGWREVAVLARGAFANIDQNEGLVVVETPFDMQLAVLSTRLNATYVPMGAEGSAGAQKQKLQDENAASLGAAAVAARGCAKATKLYSCAWDLVDAVEAGTTDLEKVAKDELPANMQEMTAGEKVAFVDAKRSERSEIQSEIEELGQMRADYIKVEMSRQGLDDALSFDAALRRAIRRQAEAKGFVFPEEEDKADWAPGEDSATAPPSLALSNLTRFPNQARPLPSRLFQNAKLSPTAKTVVAIPLDPVKHDVLVTAVQSLIARSSSPRPGGLADVRQVNGNIHAPDLVATAGSQSDWELLTALLGSPAGLRTSSVNEVWIQIGTHSYLVQNGC